MRSTASLVRLIGIANAIVVVLALGILQLMPSADAQAPARHRAARPSPVQPSAQPSTVSRPPPGVVATPEFARQVKANEAGLVPVLMYHRIVKRRWASIDRTPDQVRRELEWLARRGYVPITAREFATGDIRVPAGKFPVVLTFDDGHESHFALDAAGRPVKDTAVEIILSVAAKYPSFRPVATFWINKRPFGLDDPAQQARAVQWLVQHGFEVANHTWGHPNLRALPVKRVREQIARLERLLAELGAPPSKTMALPFGMMPHKKKAAGKGSWGGTSYDFAGVFLAGAEPSVSPFAKSFDPGAIQRIQSNGKKGECRRWCSQYWLEWLDKHPGQRYVSDGDPERISLPRGLRGSIQPSHGPRIVAY
ncbi:polysaccharide deacetylase family protein [Thermoactinospora rubra]|uniref:polysaccharide deacetylase family protein n=1 Tax=Thermoactinospora rubra TaxID=1088767 RepID=UPI000A115E2B|nr:polysaccharide deacetylase family protein [Thermoactinospora rubra]